MPAPISSSSMKTRNRPKIVAASSRAIVSSSSVETFFSLSERYLIRNTCPLRRLAVARTRASTTSKLLDVVYWRILPSTLIIAKRAQFCARYSRNVTRHFRFPRKFPYVSVVLSNPSPRTTTSHLVARLNSRSHSASQISRFD